MFVCVCALICADMARNCKQDANRNQEGFRCFERAVQGKKPYCLQWNVAGPGEKRRLKTESFASDRERKKRLDELVALREEQGRQVLRVDIAKYQNWQRLEQQAGVPLSRVVDFYVKHSRTEASLDTLIREFNEVRELEFRPESRAMDTRLVQERCVRGRLINFAGAFAGRKPCEISVQDCREWLHSLAKDYKPRTVNNYREAVNTFFNAMVREERLERNPMALVKPLPVPGREHEFYTAREAMRFFRINAVADPQIAVLVALSAFGFLRTSAVLRLEPGDIRRNPRGILCPAANQKKRRRYFIQNYPENLWAWLEWMPEDTLGMSEEDYYRRRKAATERAGLRMIDNGWRHAAATHHVAMEQSSSGTANLMQHKNEEVVWNTYRGNASQRDGRLYFEIVPRKEKGKADSE